MCKNKLEETILSRPTDLIAARTANRCFLNGVLACWGKGTQALGQWYSGVIEGTPGYSATLDVVFTWQNWYFSALVRDGPALYIILTPPRTKTRHQQRKHGFGVTGTRSFRILAAPPPGDANWHVSAFVLSCSNSIFEKLHAKQVTPATDQCPPQPCFTCVFILFSLFAQGRLKIYVHILRCDKSFFRDD